MARQEYKTVTIPRGYRGIKVEAPGVLIYVEVNDSGTTTLVDAACDMARYAGDEWVVADSQANKLGVYMRCAKKGKS